jgi:hypothetical protein
VTEVGTIIGKGVQTLVKVGRGCEPVATPSLVKTEKNVDALEEGARPLNMYYST